ncbi:hypothetical protein PPERSA_09897 [Pseudocohnilembus persalinus]|uniref:Uncharacterized protein n=1 Tax=Pseudocohnilembus persalinus TaxID=266149 RepID=A0A0V0QUH3_PSEPJ|nr:hypothetical protein PPERSA_09897 [Pseudocohnilembus persalinus]|eukprot:KRX05757.1 hypothetical protein PPERSA_09897 [Pseudocohnilembus persalinus]
MNIKDIKIEAINLFVKLKLEHKKKIQNLSQNIENKSDLIKVKNSKQIINLIEKQYRKKIRTQELNLTFKKNDQNLFVTPQGNIQQNKIVNDNNDKKEEQQKKDEQQENSISSINSEELKENNFLNNLPEQGADLSNIEKISDINKFSQEEYDEFQKKNRQIMYDEASYPN